MNKYVHMTKELHLGKMLLKNRIMMAPMTTHYASEDGVVTERMLDYYTARAKGGVGLIITESMSVHETGKSSSNVLTIHDDKMIVGLKKLSSSVKENAVHIIAQLYHGGRQASYKYTGSQIVAPSRIPCPIIKEMPKELSRAEIIILENAFVDGAKRAKEAGFDGVELDGAHGYLLNQFLSSYSNRRKDDYGGALSNRMRFALNIIKKIRTSLGCDFFISYKVSAEEYVKGGLKFTDTCLFSQQLVNMGINMIHVSGGVFESSYMSIQPMGIKQGLYVIKAKKLKQFINNEVPIAVVGRIKEPEMIDDIIKNNAADIVVLGRSLLADPNYVNKAIDGRQEQIRKCIGCNQNCIGNLLNDKSISCTVNPLCGFENNALIHKSTKKKKIIVVGGGPGGIQAALIAALNGHSVTLFEKKPYLGGTLRIASKPPFKYEINDLSLYLINQLKNLSVPVFTNKEVDFETLKEYKPDIVFLATGGVPIIPPIPGIDLPQVYTANEVLCGNKQVNDRVLIVGGGSVGCETALYLLQQRKSVTILELLEDIALDMVPINRMLLLKRLNAKNVTVMTSTALEKIEKEDIIVKRVGKTETEKLQGYLNVVIAVGFKPNKSLVRILQNNGISYLCIGDCNRIGNIGNAMRDAHWVFST